MSIGSTDAGRFLSARLYRNDKGIGSVRSAHLLLNIYPLSAKSVMPRRLRGHHQF